VGWLELHVAETTVAIERSQQILATPKGVASCLIAFADHLQPSTSSVLRFSGVGRRDCGDGLRPQVVDDLDIRSELTRRMSLLDPQDRHVLFLWYVRGLHVDDISKELGLSRRQCFRRRAGSVRALIQLGRDSMEPPETRGDRNSLACAS